MRWRPMSLNNKVEFQILCYNRTWKMRGRDVEHLNIGNGPET